MLKLLCVSCITAYIFDKLVEVFDRLPVFLFFSNLFSVFLVASPLYDLVTYNYGAYLSVYIAYAFGLVMPSA